MEPEESERLPPIHPGEILLEEFMKPYGVTQDKLAKGIGVHPGHISEIIRGKRAISPNLSMRLARYFCTSPKYWIDFQVYFDMEVEERKVGNSLDVEIAPLPAAVRHMIEVQETLGDLVETGEGSSEPIDRCYYCGNSVAPRHSCPGSPTAGKVKNCPESPWRRVFTLRTGFPDPPHWRKAQRIADR